MADFSTLNTSLTALTDQVAATETTEDGATVLINGIQAANQAAVTKALTADTAANQVSIDAANAAIAGVTTRFNASAAKLGAAIVANTPSA